MKEDLQDEGYLGNNLLYLLPRFAIDLRGEPRHRQAFSSFETSTRLSSIG